MSKKHGLIYWALVAAVLGCWTSSAAVITVAAPQTNACKKVTVENKASVEKAAGSQAQLAATANTGWAFAGWYKDYDEDTGTFSNEVELVGADWRTASAKYLVGDEDEMLYARFVQPQYDGLRFDFSDAFAVGYKLALTNAIDLVLEADSETFPTLSFSGLPSGLKFDSKTLKLTGTPTKTGVSTVKVTGKNVSGYTYSQTMTVTIDNLESDHVVGVDNETYVVGDKIEEGDLSARTLFNIDESDIGVKTIALSGLPTGLSFKYDAEMQDGDITGKPSKAGTFVVTATVTFTNAPNAKTTSEKATALVTIAPVDPFEYGVDLMMLENLAVGDSLTLEEEFELGTYDPDDKTGITAVSNLPKGLKIVKVSEEDGLDHYYVIGTVTEAARVTCKVKVAYLDDDDKIQKIDLTQDIDVVASEGVYLTAEVVYPDEETYEAAKGCKVTGSGVYVPGAVAKLTPTAASGYVFAGWYDEGGIPFTVEGVDYRKSPLSYTVTADDAGLVIYAKFVLKTDDEIDISDLDDAEFDLDPFDENGFGEAFAVVSESLPTLTFKNLPSGMTCLPDDGEAGSYLLGYDPATVKATSRPKPGRYQVTATAKNVAGKSDTASFLVTVCNLTNEVIDIEDDYGILTPNVEMTWIDFSDAVDTNDYTLAVSGNPTGTKFYTAYDKQKKIPAYTLAGVPTTPGYYTMTFTATPKSKTDKNKYTATAFITVKPFPEIAVTIDEAAEVAGCKVAGVGHYKKDTKVTLKATAAKGWVFAGWSGLDGVDGLVALNPSASYTMTTNDRTVVEAAFVEIRDDHLYVGDICELGDESVSNTAAFVRDVQISTNLIENLINTVSYPTVSISGLPSGLKFDAKTFMITGKIAKTTKVGATYATVTVKNAGGYAFTRILRCAIIAAAGDPIPADAALKNDACIDFSGLEDVYTGDWCDENALVGFTVDCKTNSELAVTAVKISGLPTGLSAKTYLDADYGMADVYLLGTPTKVGRYTVKVDVTYADKKTLKSEYAVIVQDGGSRWLDVMVPEDFEGLGTVTGSGVYASGAKVTIKATAARNQVFGGWYEDETCAEGWEFSSIAEMDGIDYRTASASFLFRQEMFQYSDNPVLYAAFGAKTDDVAPEVEFGAEDVWTIKPDEDDSIDFWAYSFSQPKVTVTGLPKGVTLDAVRGVIKYDSVQAASIVPGWYTVTVKAVNQSNQSSTSTLKVFVENKESAWIEGLDPAADAYTFMVGVAVSTNSIVPVVTNALTLSCSGLPSGLSLKTVKDSKQKVLGYYIAGVPTKACTNTVTFTASGRVDGTRLKEIATITVVVEALPAWSQGNFNGVYRRVVETEEGVETNDVGTIALSVTTAGKVSGKILAGGKSYTKIVATSLDEFDEAGTSAKITITWATGSNETFTVDFEPNDRNLGVAIVYGLGGCGAELVQNVWERKDMKEPTFATGTKQPKLTIDALVCKFGDKGKVTLSGKIDNKTVSGTTQTLTDCSDLAAGANARIAVYVTNTKFAGGAYCAVYDILLSDVDEDGKYDTVEQIAPAPDVE